LGVSFAPSSASCLPITLRALVLKAECCGSQNTMTTINTDNVAAFAYNEREEGRINTDAMNEGVAGDRCSLALRARRPSISSMRVTHTCSQYTEKALHWTPASIKLTSSKAVYLLHCGTLEVSLAFNGNVIQHCVMPNLHHNLHKLMQTRTAVCAAAVVQLARKSSPATCGLCQHLMPRQAVLHPQQQPS
jgi:hypothetical protein